MGSRRIAAALLLGMLPGVLAAACADDGATKGSDAMLGSLMKIIPEANAVAFVRIGAPAKATVQGRPWVKFPSQVLENIRGLKPGAESVDILLPESSAAELGDGGAEAVVFLKVEGAGYRLVKFSEPLAVPVQGRERFLKCVRESVSAAQPMSGATMKRQHVLNMLQSGIPFFQMDASRSALDMKGFTDAEIETLIVLVKGNETIQPVEGLTRDNVLATIFRFASPARAIAFGSEMLAEGASREIYLGLAEREPKESETIVKAFLDSADEKVQGGGLLVAGLLRRADLLDAFEGRFPRGKFPPALRAPLDQAREYVTREI